MAAGVVAAAISIAVSLILPKWYTATTSVFPPEPKSSISRYAQLLQSFQAPILGPTAIGARPSTIYIDILKSRRVGEKVIKEFDLMKVYQVKLMEDALEALHSHMYFSLLENGLLKISFEDKDRERAAAVTNRLVELLDEFNRELNVTKAARSRRFIEGQLEVHERELRKAEEALKRFQEENEAVDLDEQTRSAIDIVADLTAQTISLEVELRILGRYASKNSDEYLRRKQRYDELVAQLAKFKADSARAENDVVRSYFPTFDKVPEISLEYARLLRDVKVGEKVYELLVKEYEQARIEEAKNTPTVQILDTATPPELRSRPKRKQIVVVGTLLGIGWAALFAIFSTVWLGEESRRERVMDLLSPIMNDLRKLLRRR